MLSLVMMRVLVIKPISITAWLRLKKDMQRLNTTLGLMYGMGQDYKSAHMWFNIAVENGIPRAIKGRDIAAKEMTPSQIEKAQDMAREWMAEHQ